MAEIKYPKGYPTRPGFTKIAISFPDQLFADIITLGRKERKEFNEMVVELCKIGKFDLEESDRLETCG